MVDIDRDDHFLSHYVRKCKDWFHFQWVLGSGYPVPRLLIYTGARHLAPV